MSDVTKQPELNELQSAMEKVYQDNPGLAKQQAELREWFDDQYPLHPWGLDDLKRYGVEPLVDELFARIDQIEKRLKHWDRSTDPSGDGHNDACYVLNLEQVACSQAIVGLLAPLAETLIRESVSSFKVRLQKQTQTSTSDNDRSALNKTDFWNPEKVFCGWDDKRTRAKSRGGICEGFLQLLHSIGLKAEVSNTCEQALTALFAYRNKSLHRIVWSRTVDENGQDAAQRFVDDVSTNCWGDWFSPARIYLHDDNDELVESGIENVTVKRQFAEDVLREIDTLGRKLATRLKRLPQPSE